MTRIADFTSEQKLLLARIIDDFGGPTTTAQVLDILDRVLGVAKPDWEMDPSAFPSDLRVEVEVCIAALQHHETVQIASR